MKSKNKKIIISLIVILLVAAIGVAVFFLTKDKSTGKNTDNTNTIQVNATEQANTENKVSIEDTLRIDSTKDWVHDADYKANVSKPTYIAWDRIYDINNYKAPYVNINSNYVNTVNAEIKEIFDEAVDVFNNGVENGLAYIEIFTYEYHIYNDVLSLIITTGYGATDVIYPDYHIFNINIKTGEEVTFEELLAYKHMTLAEFDSKAIESILEKHNSYYSDEYENSEEYEQLKQETLDAYNKSDKKCCILLNEEFYLYATIFSPIGIGEDHELLCIK